MFQRQYEDDADVLIDGQVVARGYARLELFLKDDGEEWGGTFRITEPDQPPSLIGTHVLRLRDGSMGTAQLVATENIQGEQAGLAGSFLDVAGEGPCPF